MRTFHHAALLAVGLVTAACGGGGSDPDPSPPVATVHHHGDTLTIDGNFGSNDVHKTFLGGADGPIESQAAGQAMPNGGGWVFSDVGHPTTIATDARRGKVLFTPEDSQHYNATRRYDNGFAIPEQRLFYKAHYVRNVMLVDGQPFTASYQWKHERINWENSISDGACEIKVHNWQNWDVLSFINRSADDSQVYYGGKGPATNGDWALMEIMVFTGTQGASDGKLITRVFKDGRTHISQNLQAVRIYADPDRRLRYFLEQNYFGNFSQLEAGPDNTEPRPDVRELYSDDSRVIVGQAAGMGWKRVELRDQVALRDATVREVQDWDSWNGSITLRLNTGGLAPGRHQLYLVVIDGVDEAGWDHVVHSTPLTVDVPQRSVQPG